MADTWPCDFDPSVKISTWDGKLHEISPDKHLDNLAFLYWSRCIIIVGFLHEACQNSFIVWISCSNGQNLTLFLIESIQTQSSLRLGYSAVFVVFVSSTCLCPTSSCCSVMRSVHVHRTGSPVPQRFGTYTCTVSPLIWTHTDFVVHTALQVSYGGPALLLLHLRVIMEDLVPQPREIVHTQFILLPWNKNKD